MLNAIALLMTLQLGGEILTQLLHLPIPGPVLGMLALLLLLLQRQHLPESLRHVSEALLAHFSLLFVPAGVGIIVHLALLSEAWLALMLVLVGSTLLTALVTGWTLHWLLRRQS